MFGYSITFRKANKEKEFLKRHSALLSSCTQYAWTKSFTCSQSTAYCLYKVGPQMHHTNV